MSASPPCSRPIAPTRCRMPRPWLRRPCAMRRDTRAGRPQAVQHHLQPHRRRHRLPGPDRLDHGRLVEHLPAQTCETLYKGTLSSRFYYVHAIDYDRGGEWAGKSVMCTTDKTFTIRGVQDCARRGYQEHRLLRGRHPGRQGLDHPPDRSQRRGRKTQMRRSRRVKIVATLGPASYAPEMIERLFEAGVDVFRINMSHSSFDVVKKLHARRALGGSQVRAADRHPGRPAGPEVPPRRASAASASRCTTAPPSASTPPRARAAPSACSCRIRRSSRPSSPATRCCSTTARSA